MACNNDSGQARSQILVDGHEPWHFYSRKNRMAFCAPPTSQRRSAIPSTHRSATHLARNRISRNLPLHMIHDYVRTCDWFNCARVTALHVRGSWINDVKFHDGRCFNRVLGSISKPQALMSMNGGIDQSLRTRKRRCKMSTS